MYRKAQQDACEQQQQKDHGTQSWIPNYRRQSAVDANTNLQISAKYNLLMQI